MLLSLLSSSFWTSFLFYDEVLTIRSIKLHCILSSYFISYYILCCISRYVSLCHTISCRHTLYDCQSYKILKNQTQIFLYFSYLISTTGLNIANNKIGREGISMLVRSLRNNDALHTVLLGGNPGFTVEMAQNASQITSKAPLRLRYMPKGVAILLERWIKLQLSERTGGYILQDISITVTDRRSLGLTQNHENAPQQEMDIMDIHRSHTNDIIDIQNIDHDVKNIFMNEECSLKVIEKNVPQVVGSEMDVRVGTNTVIDKNSNTQQSAEWGTICASETEIPEDNFLSERSWYEEGSDVLNRCSEEQEPYLDNILQWEDESPKVTSPFESAHNIPEIKKSQVNTLVRANVSKQEVDQNPGSTVSVIPEAQEPYKRISPVYVREEVQEGAGHGLGGMTGGWVGGRVEGGVESRVESGVGGRTNGRFLTSEAPSQSDKASHSSTEKKRNRTGDESPSPRHLADSFNFNLRKGSRGGYSKDKGGYTSSPVNAAGQTPQSITPQSAHYSSDRGQKQGQGVEQGQGQGVEQRRGQGRRRRQSQGQEKKQQSPIFLIRSIHSHSESAVRYPSPRHIDDVHDSSDRGSSPNCRHTEERMTSSISSKNKKTLKNSNPKKSKKRIQNDGFNKELLDPPNFLKSHHEALEHAMSSFSDSVKEVTQSLGSVCAQLRDVTSSLSESLTELNKSHTKSPQSTAPPTHTSPTALIPGLSPSSLLFPIPIPIAVGGFGNKFADKLDFEAKKSNCLIPLGETFGRTRGSLMHREKNVSKDNEGKNDMDEYKRNDISGSSGLHRGYYDGIPSVGTVKRSTLQKVHALLGESTDRGSIPSSTMTSSGVSRSQKSGPRTRIKETTTGSTLTTERDDNNNNNNNNTIKNDAIIDGESEIEIRKTESVASQNRINSPLRDSSTSEDTSFNYSKFSRPNLGPQSRSPPPYTDILSGGGDHISQADMIAFIKERLHRKLHAVLRPL